MEEPKYQKWENMYNESLLNIEKYLNAFAICAAAGDQFGETENEEHADLIRGCIDNITDHYLKALQAAERTNIPNGAERVFNYFRIFFEKIDSRIKIIPEFKEGIEEILRRVSAPHKLDFPESKNVVSYYSKKNR